MRLKAGDARALRDGLLVGAAFVAVTTALVYPLKEVAPVEATGAVYLIAVMAISVRWGTVAGLGAALLSAAAWNFFHIPPTGRFTISEGENWVALAVFLVAAVVVSRLADDARRRADEAERRRAEAALLADLAREMLGTRTEAEARAVLASRLADALGLAPDEVQLDTRTVSGERWLVRLETEGQRLGVIQLPADLGAAERETVERLTPSLAVSACGREARGRARVRGDRGGGVAALGRGEDDAAPRGLARPALAPDRDLGGRRRAGWRRRREARS